jgi:hypothetical protein
MMLIDHNIRTLSPAKHLTLAINYCMGHKKKAPRKSKHTKLEKINFLYQKRDI